MTHPKGTREIDASVVYLVWLDPKIWGNWIAGPKIVYGRFLTKHNSPSQNALITENPGIDDIIRYNDFRLSTLKEYPWMYQLVSTTPKNLFVSKLRGGLLIEECEVVDHTKIDLYKFS